MSPSGRLNRAVMLAILPVMALTVGLAAGALGRGRTPVSQPGGRIVVANLRVETLTYSSPDAGSSPAVLALPGPPHELGVVGGRLYATLGRADGLAEVEPSAPGILRVLHMDGTPHGLAVAGDGSLLVGLDESGALATIDRVSLTEIARVSAGSIPHAVAAAAGETYVSSAGDDTVRSLGNEPAVAAAGRLPESVAIVGRFVVTADARSGTVSVYARRSLAPLGRIVVGDHPVRVLALDETHAAISLNGASAVAIVDLTRLRVASRIEVDPHPDGLCLSPDGRYLAVTSNETGATLVFEVASRRRTLAISGSPGAGACVWLSGH